jgi:glycerol uptake facilitator-like aquaporin
LNHQAISRVLFAEALGTALLLAVVVGSGIMAESLSQGNTAIALLANALATGAALPVLILIAGPVSGAHFNPIVTLSELFSKRLTVAKACGYFLAQGLGAYFGVLLAHGMFALPLVQVSDHARSGFAQILSEVVATFGLVLLIRRTSRTHASWVPALVGLYITAAYWFTASTSFANPAVTLARAWTHTFAGIAPKDILGFLLGQVLGLALAVLADKALGVAPASLTTSESRKTPSSKPSTSTTVTSK